MKAKRKLIPFAVMAFTMATTMSSFAATSGWVQTNNEWHYTDASGNYVTDKWQTSAGKRFYLDSDGNLAKDQLIEDGDNKYYVDSDGVMITNQWKKLTDDTDDKEYWYYFQNSGKAKENGYSTIDGKKYHFTDFHLDEGWSDDYSYYYGTAEDLYTPGWHYITEGVEDNDSDFEEGWYYTDNNGKLYKNKEKKINGYFYAFNEDGLMIDNWAEYTDEDGESYCKYYKPSIGSRMDGWVYIEDDEDKSEVKDEKRSIVHESGWYYLKKGRPYTATYQTTSIGNKLGIAKIKGKFYCFDENGQMQYGLQKGADGTYYYFGAENDGSMKTGRVTIEYDENYNMEGEKMYFETKGSIGSKGSSYTGIQNNYLYNNGDLVESDDGWELVTVAGKTYVVNEYGKVKKSGTFKDDNDVKWKVQERADGLGYEKVKA